MNKQALVIGGLGFIGVHVTNALKHNSYEVTVSTRSTISDRSDSSSLIYLDLDNMNDEEISAILAPYHVIVFAGGLDDRNIPKGDAWEYFYQGNVTPCVRLARLCNHLKLEHLIILGSYFSYFDRIHPDWKMHERHPYVYSRLMQRIETKKALGGDAKLSVLEIPYVFGFTPGLVPLWKPLIDYIYYTPVVFYTNGGTNICAVQQVAEAIVGIVNSSIHRDYWTVGGKNVTWKEMIKMMSNSMNKRKFVITVPNFMVYLGGAFVKFYFKLTGKQSGLDAYHFMAIQTKNTFLNTKASQQILSYSEADIQKAIDQTVVACGRVGMRKN